MCPLSTLLRSFDKKRILEPVQGRCNLEVLAFETEMMEWWFWERKVVQRPNWRRQTAAWNDQLATCYMSVKFLFQNQSLELTEILEMSSKSLTFRMRKPGLRKLKWLAEGHLACLWPDPSQIPILLTFCFTLKLPFILGGGVYFKCHVNLI